MPEFWLRHANMTMLYLQRIFACIFHAVGSSFKSSKWKGYSYSADQDIWPTPVCSSLPRYIMSSCQNWFAVDTSQGFFPVSGRMKLFEKSKIVNNWLSSYRFSQWSCDRAGWQWLGIPSSLLQWSSVRAPLSVSTTSTLCNLFFSICLNFAYAFTSVWELLQGQQENLVLVFLALHIVLSLTNNHNEQYQMSHKIHQAYIYLNTWLGGSIYLMVHHLYQQVSILIWK